MARPGLPGLTLHPSRPGPHPSTGAGPLALMAHTTLSAPSQTRLDLMSTLATLLGSAPILVPADGQECPWSVWDPTTDDLIGIGESADEALEEAVETVREWR